MLALASVIPPLAFTIAFLAAGLAVAQPSLRPLRVRRTLDGQLLRGALVRLARL